MSFTRSGLAAVEAWADSAKPLDGIYYRSVEYRFMDPAEVLNGKGRRRMEPVCPCRNQGCFPRGVRHRPFGGSAGSQEPSRRQCPDHPCHKYPRIVFGVNVSLERVLDLSKTGLPKEFASVRKACLDPDNLAPSMELGHVLQERSIQDLVFPSAVGAGKNLIVYRDLCQLCRT